MEPGAGRLLASGSSKTAARLSLDSPRSELRAAARGGREGRRARSTGFPLVSRRRRLQSRKWSLHQTSVVFKYSRGRLTRQGPPRPRGGLRGAGVSSGGEKLLSPSFFFRLFLVQNSVCHFLNPNQTTACDRRQVAGMLALGFSRLKNTRGCLPNCCFFWAWSLEERCGAAAELGFGAAHEVYTRSLKSDACNFCYICQAWSWRPEIGQASPKNGVSHPCLWMALGRSENETGRGFCRNTRDRFWERT